MAGSLVLYQCFPCLLGLALLPLPVDSSCWHLAPWCLFFLLPVHGHSEQVCWWAISGVAADTSVQVASAFTAELWNPVLLTVISVFSACARDHDYPHVSCFQCPNRPSCKTADSCQGSQADECMIFTLYFQAPVHISKELSIVLEYRCSW